MGRKLYVGNLGFDVTDQELQAAFAEVGAVDSATVVTDRDSGRSRGFGFVEMTSDGDAQKAIQQLDGKTMRDRAIKVSEARDRDSSRGGGGRGRGGPGGGGGGRGGPGGGGGGRGGR